MDWRCGSSNSAPALQVWRPEFKSQSYHKKKKSFARIAVWSQPGQIVLKTLSQKKKKKITKKGWWSVLRYRLWVQNPVPPLKKKW
jgi:hypothetical protein